ncbi:hypothetical protein D3C80_1719910 [compost metagenome]
MAAILKSYSDATCLMNFTQPKSASTEVIGELPLEANSKLILPVPANKSNTFNPSKLKWLFKTLNNASLDISVVGRTGSPFGGKMRLPLYFPEMILMS